MVVTGGGVGYRGFARVLEVVMVASPRNKSFQGTSLFTTYFLNLSGTRGTLALRLRPSTQATFRLLRMF